MLAETVLALTEKRRAQLVGTERTNKTEKKGEERLVFKCKRCNNMNKIRRDKIKIVLKKIECNTKELESILSDECEAYDNMPDGLKCTDNGFVSEEAQETIESAIDALYEAIGYLEEI
jgi:hypothetical protein